MGKKSTKGFKRSVKPTAYHQAEIDLQKSLTDAIGTVRDLEYEEELKDLVRELKPSIVSIAERAFRRYCKKHNAPRDVEELEWTRFKKILVGML